MKVIGQRSFKLWLCPLSCYIGSERAKDSQNVLATSCVFLLKQYISVNSRDVVNIPKCMSEVAYPREQDERVYPSDTPELNTNCLSRKSHLNFAHAPLKFSAVEAWCWRLFAAFFRFATRAILSVLSLTGSLSRTIFGLALFRRTHTLITSRRCSRRCSSYAHVF